MSDIFITLSFTLVLLHFSISQAMQNNEKSPLLTNPKIYYQSKGNNYQYNDYLLTVTNEKDDKSKYWILSNSCKMNSYLKPANKPIIESYNPQTQLIKNKKTIDLFLKLTSKQQSDLLISEDLPTETSQPKYPMYSAVTKMPANEDDIYYSLYRVLSESNGIFFNNSQERIEWMPKEATLCDYLKFYCCLSPFSKAFGRSHTPKQSNKATNEYYNGD